MKTLGTILPTRETLRLADEYALTVRRMQAKTALDNGFRNPRFEQGEIRYYKGPDLYAVCSRKRAGRVLWFERRSDGYFYSKATTQEEAGR